MKYDLILGGVGGQGILSIAFVVDNASLASELHVKQSEVHGMAQRGGAVSSHLRISDQPIFSDLVPLGGAHLILAVEPMEALRYKEYLRPDGMIVSGTAPVENIPDYPEVNGVLDALAAFPRAVLLNADKIAREAGSGRAQNMVALGAAAPYLPLTQDMMERFIHVLFGKKGDKIIATNVNAFRYGLANGRFYAAAREAGADPQRVLAVMDRLDASTVDPAAAPAWAALCRSPAFAAFAAWAADNPKGRVPGTAEQAATWL